MSYYETNADKWNEDCHTLNSAIGYTMDELEENIGKGYDDTHNQEFITQVIPTVLMSLLAKHFKHFHFNKPEDILNYMNLIKKSFTEECDDREEMDMVKSIDYRSEVTAWKKN